MKEAAWERPLVIAGAGGGAEAEGTVGLALSLSTPMSRPVTYSRICCWQVHRDWYDGAGSRRPSCYSGSPPSLRVCGVGLGACGAIICFVPSTPYRHTMVFPRVNRNHWSYSRVSRSARCLGPREGCTTCCSRSRASVFCESKGCTGRARLCVTVIVLLQVVTRSRAGDR